MLKIPATSHYTLLEYWTENKMKTKLNNKNKATHSKCLHKAEKKYNLEQPRIKYTALLH